MNENKIGEEIAKNIRQTPEESKVISVDELQERFIKYFQELPMWGSYTSMSSALVDIAAPYIRQAKEQPTTEPARAAVRRVLSEIERLKDELAVFKEGMRAIKSALDFIQSN